MRKIPYPTARKILQPLIDSDHEVMTPFKDVIKEWLEDAPTADDVTAMEALINYWLDNLQEMYDKAEKVDELENNIYRIDELTDEATGVMDQIRGYCND